MVTHGVRDLVSTSEATASKPSRSASEPVNAPAKPAAHKVAEPEAKTTSKLNIPPEQVVEQLNTYLENSGRSLSFSIDQGSGKTVVKVYNSGTDELIRQFPAEQVLKLAEVFRENQEELSGLLLDARA